MKNNILTVFVLLLTISFTTINAQTDQGNWVLGGSTTFSFSSTNTKLEFDGEQQGDDLKSSAINITPSVGYFVIDNLAVGLDLGYTSTKVEDETSSTFTGVLGGSYYFNASDNLKPYVGLGGGYTIINYSDEDAEKFSGLTLRGVGGIAYFINESISFNFLVQYLNLNLKNKADSDFVSKSSSIGAGVGVYLYL